MVFGRLAPGATLERAQTELTTLGQRAATEFPDTHMQLRPRVLPYAEAMFGSYPGFFSPELMLTNFFIVGLVVLLCANVGLLMFARAATRQSELVVRNALGASRGRIVGQLFSEALVLGVVAAIVGLAVGNFFWRWGLTVYSETEGQLPFWFSNALSPTTVIYAGVLTLLGAVVAGVLPGLNATRGIGERLKQGTTGGGMRLGGVWAAVIVAQVAVTLTFPAVALFLQQEAGENESLSVEVPLEEYLSVRLDMDREYRVVAARDTSQAGFAARYGATLQELERRLAAEPVVTAVTFVDRLPRAYHAWNQIEMSEGAIEPPDYRGHRVSRAEIEPDYFEVLGAPVLSGRGFDSRDSEADARVVIVDEPFVERVLGGRNPTGLLVRYVATQSSPEPTPEGPWYQIVGVVGDLGMASGYGRGGIYHPSARGDTYPVRAVLRVRGDAKSFMPQLRSIAAAVDPTLQLQGFLTLDEVVDAKLGIYAYWFRLSALLSAVALMLSLVGIYSVMSYTVSRRTREIGIRVALGSHPRRILPSIFRRPLLQVSAGIVVGSCLVGLMIQFGISSADGLSARESMLVAAYAALMMCVCMLACVVPTRRALRVEPVEALGVDG